MCPLHVEARAFLGLMAAGKTQEARKMLERTMPLACLTAYLCEGDCLNHCVRARLDDPIQLPQVERACIAATRTTKPFPLPASGKRIAVAGSDLSSLAVAWELGKKGHAVSLFYQEPLGASLTTLTGDKLPPDALAEARAQLQAVRVALLPITGPCGIPWLQATLAEHQAVYLGYDDLSLFPQENTLRPAYPATDPLTLETADPRVFCGGSAAPSRIIAVAEAKRAAGSIDRLLQGVAPATAREREAVYPTRLFTNVEGVVPAPAITPADLLAPTPEEARAEAQRCLQCECLECVKQCPYLARYKGYPKKYAREMYNNLSVVHGLRQTNLAINSCAQCGLCAVICPNNADMGAFCAAARREMVTTNRMPPSAHEFALEDMEHGNAPDIAFARHQPGHNTSAYLLFPGCQLPASLPAQTEALYDHLGHHLPGGVGLAFRCCGAPARWSGRETLTRATADAFHDLWQSMGQPVVLVACASCLAIFHKELPHIPAQAVWETLTGLPLPEGAAPAAGLTLALHDPCAAREDAATCASVRSLLHTLGQATEELPFSAARTRCCGYGGLADAANPDLGREFAVTRASDTETPLLAYCIMCRERLAAVGAPTLHLLELLFPVADAATALKRTPPGISDRQRARVDFRRGMLHSRWHEAPAPLAEPGFRFSCAPGVAETLEARRILHSDIQAVLAHAGKHGPQFTHTATGRSMACLRPRQVTFWVEYEQQADNTYLIHDAYCHRMVVPGVPGEGLPSPCTLEGYASKGGRM